MHYSFWEKLAGSLLLTAWVLYLGNMIGDKLVPVTDTHKAMATADAPAAPTKTAAAPAAKAVDALSLLAAADMAAGKKVFKKCKACHTTAEGDKNKVGPNLFDIVGRPRARGAGFSYSGAMKDAGGHWGYAELDAFLTSPRAAIPGNKMSFKGVSNPAKRAALIAFLRGLSANPLPLP